jgi:hypothetical protein
MTDKMTDKSFSGAAAKTATENIPDVTHPPNMQRIDDDTLKIPDFVKPAPPPPENTPSFQFTGPVWWLSLDNDQTEKDLPTAVAGGGWAISLAFGPLTPAVIAYLTAGLGYIESINVLGGNNGVDINGVLGSTGLIVTPRVGKVYGELIQAARLAVSGRTIIDFVLNASSKMPGLASSLGLTTAATVAAQVASGTPLGWALCAGLGLAVDLLSPSPDPNQHGAVMADRTAIGPWESFIMGQVGDGTKTSLLSWQGLFSAQMAGGAGVYANRPVVGDWETWNLINNNDGTISFQTSNGHFLCAEEGGGRECQANRTSIGNWEKFISVFLPDGKIALATHDKRTYVSVQA